MEEIEKKEKIKVFAYLRKSTEDTADGESRRQLNSIEAQRNAVVEIAQKNNLEIVDTFEDSKTGYIAYARDGFNEMINQLEERKDVVGVVCSEHNRLARNFGDGGIVLWFLQSGEIEYIFTHDKSFTNSSSDQMMLAINFAMAKHSSDETSYRMRIAWNKRAGEGQPPNQRLLGYDYFGKKGQKYWVRSPKFAPLILKLFEEYSTGKYNIEEIGKYMATHGFVNPKTGIIFSKNTILSTLKKEEYMGTFTYNGKKWVGTYKPIITKELFDKVQLVLSGKGHPKESSDNEYAYTGGLVICGVCGENMSGTLKKGHIYYRCLNRKNPCMSDKSIRPSYLRETAIDAEISKVLKKIQISEKTFNELSEHIKFFFDGEDSKYVAEIRKLKTQLKTSKKELSMYTKDLLSMKKAPRIGRNENWYAEVEGIKALILDSQNDVTTYEDVLKKTEQLKRELPSKMINFFIELKTVGVRFEHATPSNRRKIVDTLCANFVWDGEKLDWKWKKQYYMLTNTQKRNSKLCDQDSNLEPNG